MPFNEVLKEIRIRKGFTQQQVADALEITKGTYSGYETGRREPDVFKIKALARLFGVSGDELLETGFNNKVINFTSEEEKHIKKYRALDEHGKMLVDNILDLEYKRVTSEKSKKFIVDIAARGGRKEVVLSEEGYKSLMADIEKGINSEFPDIFDKREKK